MDKSENKNEEKVVKTSNEIITVRKKIIIEDDKGNRKQLLREQKYEKN